MHERDREIQMTRLFLSLSACVFFFTLACLEELHENQYGKPRGGKNARMTLLFCVDAHMCLRCGAGREESERAVSLCL